MIKKLLLLCLLCFSISNFGNNKLVALGANTCFNSYLHDHGCSIYDPWTLVTNAPMTIPSCPLCTLRVTYIYRYCNGVLLVEITKIEIPVSFISHDCDCIATLIGVTTAGSQPDFTKVKDFYKLVFDELTNELFTAYYNNLSPTGKLAYKCPPEGTSQLEILGFFGSCTYYCAQYFPPSGSSDGKYVIQDGVCGTMCCYISKSYCWDTSTNSIRYTYSEGPGGADCSTSTPPDATHGGIDCTDGFYHWLSDCIPFCNTP